VFNFSDVVVLDFTLGVYRWDCRNGLARLSLTHRSLVLVCPN
jgi:hypothetical protein